MSFLLRSCYPWPLWWHSWRNSFRASAHTSPSLHLLPFATPHPKRQAWSIPRCSLYLSGFLWATPHLHCLARAQFPQGTRHAANRWRFRSWHKTLDGHGWTKGIAENLEGSLMLAPHPQLSMLHSSGGRSRTVRLERPSVSCIGYTGRCGTARTKGLRLLHWNIWL